MPLFSCPDCGKQVSSLAPACIHCGRPIMLTKPRPDTTPSASGEEWISKGAYGFYAGNIVPAPTPELKGVSVRLFSDGVANFAATNLFARKSDDGHLGAMTTLSRREECFFNYKLNRAGKFFLFFEDSGCFFDGTYEIGIGLAGNVMIDTGFLHNSILMPSSHGEKYYVELKHIDIGPAMRYVQDEIKRSKDSIARFHASLTEEDVAKKEEYIGFWEKKLAMIMPGG